MPATNLLEVLDDIEDSAENYSSFKEWEAMLKTMSEEIKEQSKHKAQVYLNLTTMHGSKGLEFNPYLLWGQLMALFHIIKVIRLLKLREERRLLY